MAIYDTILPELLVGAALQHPDDIDALKRDAGVSAVVSLQTDTDLERLDIDWQAFEARYAAYHIEYRRLPVTDFDAADLRRKLPAGVDLLDELIGAGHTVYLHCTLGVERSPSVAVAYLAWRRGWRLDKAWEHVRQCRQCAPNFEAVWLAHQEHSVSRSG